MTGEGLPLIELPRKAGEADFLRTIAETVLQRLMEADVEGLTGAARRERSAERLNWRNGDRERSLDTRLGPLTLKIPKLRQGSYFPPFLEARKTTEKALVAVSQEAWIGGVSTRRVDELAQAMGLAGISRSQSLSPRKRGSPGCAKTSNEDAIKRLTGGVLMEQNGEWQTQNRYMQIEGFAERPAPALQQAPLQMTPKAA